MLVPVSVSIEFHCMDKKVQLKKSEGTKTVELPTLVKKKNQYTLYCQKY